MDAGTIIDTGRKESHFQNISRIIFFRQNSHQRPADSRIQFLPSWNAANIFPFLTGKSTVKISALFLKKKREMLVLTFLVRFRNHPRDFVCSINLKDHM